MADEKKQGLFGIEVALSKADDEAERELQPMEQDMNEAGEPAFEGEPEFEEDLEDDSEDSLTYSNGSYREDRRRHARGSACARHEGQPYASRAGDLRRREPHQGRYR